MRKHRSGWNAALGGTLLRLALFGVTAWTVSIAALGQTSGQTLGSATAPARQLGTVKAVSTGLLTLTTAAGADVVISVADGVPVMEPPPGSTDLKAAAPGKFEDIGVGDRVLANVSSGPAGLTASRLIVMKSGAIAARKTSQQQEWQLHGTSGLVRGVEGTKLTIAAGSHTETVLTTPATIFRRYAADSVAFSDAKVGTLGQIHTGDQLSVRGSMSADGGTVTADEVVTGTFENLSGALQTIDVQTQTMTLKDLVTRQMVTVQVTPNSNLRKLLPQAAAAFAARNAAKPAGSAGAGNRAAGMDLSRMLARLPSETLADLKPGDAVMIVASKGQGSLTAVTMLSGVEQILSAHSSEADAVTLSPWNLSTGDGGGGQ